MSVFPCFQTLTIATVCPCWNQRLMFTFVYTALYHLMGFTSVLVFATHQQLPHILEKETPQLHISLYTLLLLISSPFHYFFIWMYFFVTYLLIVFWGIGRREMLLPGNCLLLVQMYWGFEKVFQVFWNWGMWTSWSLDWVRSILTGCVRDNAQTQPLDKWWHCQTHCVR